jgi:hypothetical protein
MTEAEWLASGVPSDLLNFLTADASERKFRLFGVASTRHLGAAHWNRAAEDAMQIAERFVDGAEEDIKLTAAFRRVYGSPFGIQLAESGWHHAKTWADQGNHHLGLRPGQAALLRDIFGNPFRPVAFDPDWRTSTAVAIARGMYESRDFSAMPILADALQDAGCDNDDVLNHCRNEKKVHVRGCWVVDLVLGKE